MLRNLRPRRKLRKIIEVPSFGGWKWNVITTLPGFPAISSYIKFHRENLKGRNLAWSSKVLAGGHFQGSSSSQAVAAPGGGSGMGNTHFKYSKAS